MKFPGLSLSIFALLAGPALGQDEAREPAPDEVSYEETQELIDRIQARIDRMEKSRAEADTSMEFLTRQIEKAMAELLGKQSETAALREQAIGLSSEVQSLAVTRDELNSELARVTSEHDAVVAQLEVQTARLEAQVSGLAELLALEQQTTDQLRESLDEGTLELRATVEERDRLSRRLAETQDRSALTERELEARETRLGELLARAGVTERLLEQERLVSRSTQERIDLLNRQLRELRKQLAALNDALDASEVRNGKQQTAIVDLNQRLTRALALKVQELAQYRSEFFGRLREVLGERSDIRIVGDRFVFQSEVLFATGVAEIGESGKEQLRYFARTLRDIATTIPSDINWVLRVDGHTDDRPIQTSRFPSNWELSTARAISVVKFLVEEDIPAERLVAAGFGEFHPLDARTGEEAYRRNRRIEFKLTQN